MVEVEPGSFDHGLAFTDIFLEDVEMAKKKAAPKKAAKKAAPKKAAKKAAKKK
ncbi:MAG: hypothetical protein ACO1RA_00715 [Planctomycetaceae bacterium]